MSEDKLDAIKPLPGRDKNLDLLKVTGLCVDNFITLEDADSMLFGLDGKRPFGNRDWEADVIEELNIKDSDDEFDYSEANREYAHKLVLYVPIFLKAVCDQLITENEEGTE